MFYEKLYVNEGHLIKYWEASLFQYTLKTKITKIGMPPPEMKKYTI